MIAILRVWVIGLSLIGTALADDLPRIGYSEKIPVEDLAAKGFRWVTVDGPYAGATEEEARKITSNRTDSIEIQMVEEGRAYYLIPGTLVRVTRDDQANGMSEILLGGITNRYGLTIGFSLIVRSATFTGLSRHQTCRSG